MFITVLFTRTILRVSNMYDLHIPSSHLYYVNCIFAGSIVPVKEV
jgi:hypothetical protein